LDNGSSPIEWKLINFDDSNWNSGFAELGYGDNDEKTIISFGNSASQKYITSYFRKKISIPDLSVYSEYELDLKRDDGAIVYINGIEVIRSNMPEGLIQPSTLALESASDDGKEFYKFKINKTYLKTGENIIAVELHQNSASSSDLSFDMSLTGVSTNPSIVEYFLSGGITETSAKISVKTSANATVKCLISTKNDLSNPITSEEMSLSSSNGFTGQFNINALIANQQYYYGFEVNQSVDKSPNMIGQFRTFLSKQPYSFHFALASCANTSSSSPVFDSISKSKPLFYLNTGDLFYGDIAENNISLYREAFKKVFTSSTQSILYKSTAFVYTWDDHDYGPNNSDGSSVSKPAALANYKNQIPSYPLSNSDAIYHSFIVGRVKFIVSDLRSQKQPTLGKLMGDTQLSWFKNEVLDAQNKDLMIAWVSSIPYISDGGNDASDNWAAFTSERTEIADFFKENKIKNIFILSGDAHMLAIDNGLNSDYSSMKNGTKIPVFQAAALDRGGSYKGGPYSQGAFQGGGQYGIVEVIDNGGDNLCIKFRGRSITLKNDVINYQFCKNSSITASHQQNMAHNFDRLNISATSINLSDELEISYLNTDQVKTNIEIIDLNGKILISELMTCDKASCKKIISKKTLQSGVYHILIKNEIECISRKLVVE
jgi:alkaline phosphatase D